MLKKRGFLSYDPAEDTYTINWHETLSILVGTRLLEELLAARGYIKGRLLDVGCGKRPYSLIYDSLVTESFGTEVTFSPHGTDAADLISYAETLPFESHSFDTILCTEVLEHTRQPFQVLEEFARILKPNGHLLLSVPFIYPIHEAPHDYWRFTTHGLQSLCESVELTPLYVHAKGGIGATSLSLALLLIVRVLNAFSKVFNLSPPLREWKSIGWLLYALQQSYLWLAKTLPTPFWQAYIGSWMTPGYVLVARKSA